MNKRLLLSTTLLTACVLGAVNFSFSAMAKGGDHCGVDYNKNLKTDFSLQNGTVTIRNSSDECDYEVGLASYKVYMGKSKNGSAWLETQTLHDAKTAYVDTKQSVTLQVALPDCSYQLDAFRGAQVVQQFDKGSENNAEGYKDRLLDAGINSSKPLCGSTEPTPIPTATPTKAPTATPTKYPTATPTKYPTATPTKTPTATPTKVPTATPTKYPTPTVKPSVAPTATPTNKPTATPTVNPSHTPTPTPTCTPTPNPSHSPTPTPTQGPTATPTPTSNPSQTPTPTPTNGPTATPTVTPTNGPTATPTPTTVVTNPTATPTPVVLATTKGGQPVYEVKGVTTTPSTGPETFALFALIPSSMVGFFLRRKGIVTK